MGYVLLWIESLAGALLLLATILAYITHSKRRRTQIFLSVLVFLALLGIYAGLTGMVGYMTFGPSVNARLFEPFLYLTVVFALGGIWILARGLRKIGEEPSISAAATWPLGQLAVVLFVTIALGLMTFWNLDLAVKQRLATLRTEAGALITSIAPARVPDRDNAALVYLQAFEAMGHEKDWPEAWNEKWWDRKTDFDPMDSELERFLDRQAPAIELLHRAAEKSSYYFERNYGHPLEIGFPEFMQLRQAVRLLELHASQKAAKGDVRIALKDIDTIFTIAFHINSEPFVISLLITVAYEKQAVETLQNLFLTNKASMNDLSVLKIENHVSYLRDLKRSLIVEEAAGLYAFCNFDGSRDRDLRQLLGIFGKKDAGMFDPFRLTSLYRVFLLTDDLEEYRQIMRKYKDFLGQTYNIYLPKYGWDWLERDIKTPPQSLVSRKIILDISKCFRKVLQADAIHRLARLGVGMYRYRAQHDRYPDELADLAPDFIPAVPRDPYDGQPMRLKHTERGIVLYSIGPDLVDDGGVKFDSQEKTGDITFELAR